MNNNSIQKSKISDDMLIRYKPDKLPASYGYPLRKYWGISAPAFKKKFGISVDEALKISKGETK